MHVSIQLWIPVVTVIAFWCPASVAWYAFGLWLCVYSSSIAGATRKIRTGSCASDTYRLICSRILYRISYTLWLAARIRRIFLWHGMHEVGNNTCLPVVFLRWSSSIQHSEYHCFASCWCVCANLAVIVCLSCAFQLRQCGESWRENASVERRLWFVAQRVRQIDGGGDIYVALLALTSVAVYYILLVLILTQSPTLSLHYPNAAGVCLHHRR